MAEDQDDPIICLWLITFCQGGPDHLDDAVRLARHLTTICPSDPRGWNLLGRTTAILISAATHRAVFQDQMNEELFMTLKRARHWDEELAEKARTNLNANDLSLATEAQDAFQRVLQFRIAKEDLMATKNAIEFLEAAIEFLSPEAQVPLSRRSPGDFAADAGRGLHMNS